MTPADEGWIQTPPAAPAARWRLRERTLDLSTPRIMAICNVTPDSFSDGGRHATVDAALRYAEAALREGADILDIGGESTRPGATPVPVAEELARVVPVVAAVHARLPELALSVDTVKAAVAEAALDTGAHIVNDVAAGRLDDRMFAVVASWGAGMVLMHSRGDVSEMASYSQGGYGGDVAAAVGDALLARTVAARAAGIPPDALVLDPGLGFGKTTSDSCALVREMSRLVALGYPVLVGASRKRFIGELTGIAEPGARALGSAVAHLLAVQRGARIVRTHDVGATRQALAVLAGL